MIVFEATWYDADGKYHRTNDLTTAEDAIKLVESGGATSGSVIQFNKTPNPNFTQGCAECWRYEYRSCAMWTWQQREIGGERAWWAHDIFSGTGSAYRQERPN
jgi:hypothetical protein